MRVSDLSRESAIPVPTIKYYLREGLLHRGETTSPNQARYDASHLRRLRLIRALLEVGNLPVVTVRDVLASIDDPDLGLFEMLGKATHPLTIPPGGDADDPDLAAAAAEVDALVERNGWSVGPDVPTRRAAAAVVARMRVLDQGRFADQLDEYARAAEQLAQIDLQPFVSLTDREEVAEAALVGTVLGDALISALRRMAHENVSRKYFPQDVTQPATEDRP